MPNFADFQKMVREEKERRDEASPYGTTGRRALHAAAVTAQTAIDHPGWAMFEDQLLTLLEQANSRLDVLAKRLLWSKEADVLTIRLEIFKLQGEITGLTQAKEILPSIVRRGEEASRGTG